MKEKLYMHAYTSSIDTREGWIESYMAEELEERGLTAEEAFEQDEGVTLFEMDRAAMEAVAEHPEQYGISPALLKMVQDEVRR